MSEAIRFLHAFAQALATMALYAPGHPAARRAIEGAWQALTALLEHDAHPSLLFLGSAPVYAGRALHELADWPWSRRLADVAAQRLDLDRALTPEHFERLLETIQARLSGDPARDEVHFPGASLGAVVVEAVAEPEEELEEGVAEDAVRREVVVDLADEIEAMRFVFAEAAEGRVARAEVEAVARLLTRVLEEHALPVAAGSEAAHPAVHAVNTALLVGAAVANTGLEEGPFHALLVAALWHDIGVARLPFDLTTKSSLSEEERRIVERHTTLGAALLLEAGLALPAVVAAEHHLRPDGNGYPSRRLSPPPHWASSVVGVAASYAAVRAPRAYRAAWNAERAARYVEEGAGTVFDAEAARLIGAVLAG